MISVSWWNKAVQNVVGWPTVHTMDPRLDTEHTIAAWEYPGSVGQRKYTKVQEKVSYNQTELKMKIIYGCETIQDSY